MTTLTGTFTSFNVTGTFPRLRTDDGHSVIVGVPRGDLEDLARECWKNRARVEITGPSNSRDGVVTAINIETLKAVEE